MLPETNGGNLRAIKSRDPEIFVSLRGNRELSRPQCSFFIWSHFIFRELANATLNGRCARRLSKEKKDREYSWQTQSAIVSRENQQR
jgi:hypothetical protein